MNFPYSRHTANIEAIPQTQKGKVTLKMRSGTACLSRLILLSPVVVILITVGYLVRNSPSPSTVAVEDYGEHPSPNRRRNFRTFNKPRMNSIYAAHGYEDTAVPTVRKFEEKPLEDLELPSELKLQLPNTAHTLKLQDDEHESSDEAADEHMLYTGDEEGIDLEDLETYAEPEISHEPDLQQNPHRYAYLTLCAHDSDVFSTLVLFQQLRRVNASMGDFAAMVIDVSPEHIQLLAQAGIKALPITEQLENVRLGYLKPGVEATGRDHVLWNKLFVWTFTQYDKILMVDTDIVIVQNIDELFMYNELAGSAMVDPGEKIVFYDPSPSGANSSIEKWFADPWKRLNAKYKDPETQLGVGSLGLNSGLIVLQPSMETYNNMLLWVSRLKHRPCCPTQEFLFRYFEAQGKYTRLPPQYHVRRIKYVRPVYSAMMLRKDARVYHYVSRSKPLQLGRKTNDKIIRIWQRDAVIVKKWMNDDDYLQVTVPPEVKVTDEDQVDELDNEELE